MPIKVECDICGARYRVDDRRAGTEIPCKECDSDIFVPGQRRRGGPDRGRGRPDRSGARRRPAPRGRGRDFDDDGFDEERGTGGSVKLIVGIVSGVLVAGIVVGVMLTMKDDEDPAKNNNVAKNDPQPAQNAPRPNNFRPNPQPRPVPKPNPKPVKPQPKPQPVNPVQPINPQPVNPVVENNPLNKPEQPRGFQPPKELPKPLPGNDVADLSVQPDPLPEPLKLEDERKLRVPFPPSVNVKDVLWPTHPSFFVALGNNDSDRNVREVFDIRSRKGIGKIGGFRAWGGVSALSPDGKFFAVSNNSSNGVYVWDVEAEKPKGTLPLAARWGAKFLGFASEKRLAAAIDSGSPLQTWSLPDGLPERTIQLPKEFVPRSVTFSPGGKYVAAYNKKKEFPAIHFYDLDTGESAGAVGVPRKGDSDFWVPDCHCLMFSPDGSEIAGFFEEFGQGKNFFVFDLKSGDLTFEFKYPEERNQWWPDANTSPIQWFPHKNRWLLFGNYLLDREVGKIVWNFSNNKNFAAGRRVLNNDLMVGAAEEKNRTSIVSFPVEEDKIAHAADTVGAGGELVDAKLPPLTAIDRSNIAQLGLDVGIAQWTASPDPAPAGESPLKESVSVTATGGKMTDLLLSNPEAGRAVVYSQLQGPGIPSRRPIPGRSSAKAGSYAHLDVYNLRTGRRVDQFDLEFPTKMKAFSPSGNFVASVLQPGEDRLDIWATGDGSSVKAFRPYNEEDKNSRKITAVAFVDDDHVLTMNNQKKLVLWKLPECKAIYEIPEATQPGLSPNQKYLAVSTGRGYLLLDSRTGQQVGSFNIEGIMHAAAFHSDGRRFAASCTGPRGPSIVVWSLDDGSVITEFPIQRTATAMHWCDKSHLLMNNDTLVDTENQLIVWKYRIAPGGAHSPQSPDGRHWYITSRGASGAALVASNFPEPKVAEFLAMKTLAPEFLLEPGGKISADIQIPDSGPGQQGMQKRALENLVSKYQNMGTTVGGGSELVISMTLSEVDTGKTQTVVVSKSRGPGFGPVFGPTSGGDEYTIGIRELECKIAYTYQGQTLNVRSSTFSNRIGGFFGERLKEGDSAEQHLTKKMWNYAAGFFASYSPPVFVFRDFEGKGFGLSTLSDRGPIAQGVGG